MPTPVGLSASRSAAVLGLSRWSTPVSVWLEIMEAREPGFCKAHGYEPPEREYNTAMRLGHAFEGSIIELAEQKMQSDIIDREKFFEVSDPVMLTCHIDGRYYQSEILHEGKTTNLRYFRDYFGEPGTDKVPIEYQLQCQHQMICTGADQVILSVLVFPRTVDEWEAEGWEIKEDPDGEFYLRHLDRSRIIDPIMWALALNDMGFFHQYHIRANQELQSEMVKKYTEFWTGHVLTGIPPEVTSADDIKALCPEPVGTIIADERVERLMSEYKQIGAEISTSGPLGKRREEIKVEILKYMTTAGAVTDDESRDKFILRDRQGRKLVSWARSKSGAFVFR